MARLYLHLTCTELSQKLQNTSWQQPIKDWDTDPETQSEVLLLQWESRTPRDAGHFEPDRHTLNPIGTIKLYLIDHLKVQSREESETQ